MLIREADQGGADQQFVRQRIHELAEIRDHIVVPGHVAVDKVRDAGQDEHRQGGVEMALEVQVQQHQEHRDHHHPGHGQLIGCIHGVSSSYRTPTSSPS